MWPESPTLLRRLLLALLPALIVLAGIGAVVDYLQLREMVDEAYDQTLATTAMVLAARLESERDNDLPIHMSALARVVPRHDGEEGLRFVVLASGSGALIGDAQLATLAAPPGSNNPSFSETSIDGRPMRVVTYRYAGPDGNALIVVAEGLQVRRDAAGRAVRINGWTNLLMIAAAVGVVTIGVRAALRPLLALGASASQHETGSLRPLATGTVPLEVRPLVEGLNRLIDRLRVSTQAQQAFLSASAHQLRTPLTALQAQLDVLLDDSRSSRWHARLEGLSGSVRRLTRMTQQMLALARTDAGARGGTVTQAPVAVDLVCLLQDLTAEHLDAALERDVDLGLETEPARVWGERWMLEEMVTNLIENALRYAPAHSEVTLRCGTHVDAAGAVGAFVEVEDAGPGIPPGQRERVFERFVRLSEAEGPGTGLGLSIVKEVANAHRATVRIFAGPEGRGTRVRVAFGARAEGRQFA